MKNGIRDGLMGWNQGFTWKPCVCSLNFPPLPHISNPPPPPKIQTENVGNYPSHWLTCYMPLHKIKNWKETGRGGKKKELKRKKKSRCTKCWVDSQEQVKNQTLEERLSSVQLAFAVLLWKFVSRMDWLDLRQCRSICFETRQYPCSSREPTLAHGESQVLCLFVCLFGYTR